MHDWRKEAARGRADDAEDEPFRMRALNQAELADIQEMADSLQILRGETGPSSVRCNRFFGGVCLALPLSVVLWYLFYQGMHYLMD